MSARTILIIAAVSLVAVAVATRVGPVRAIIMPSSLSPVTTAAPVTVLGVA